jgi:hypothetical protein
MFIVISILAVVTVLPGHTVVAAIDLQDANLRGIVNSSDDISHVLYIVQ